VNIHAWSDYSYYDGMWCFAQVLLRLDPDSYVTSASVRWLNSEMVVRRREDG
jgi:hypothetical protein